MALGSNPYRKVFIDDMAKLQDLSVLAERAYIHLAFGQRSTACCLVRMKPDALRLELREHSRAKVTAALDELEAAGWVSIDRQTWTIALPVQAQRTPSENASVSQGKLKEAQKFPPSRQRDEVLNTIAQELARWPGQSAHREGDGGDTVTRTSNSNSNSISNSSPVMDTGAPAVAVDKPKRAKAAAEIPPDLGETISLFASLGSNENEARKCYLYFESKGWKRGRDTIKSWKATCEGWVRNSYGQTGKGLPAPRTTTPTDPDDVVEEDGFTPRQRRDAEAQFARMKKENDDYDAAQLAKRSQAGLFGPQSRPLLAGQR